MYKYLVAFALISPLIGIYLVEQGEYAGSVGVNGSPNGATAAFLAYLAVVLITALIATRVPRFTIASTATARFDPEHADQDCDVSAARFQEFSVRLFWVNVLFLMILLFAFGGIRVWFGTVGKGVFRATLGPFGAVAYLMTKVTLPALFAFSTILYARAASSKKRNASLWWWNAALIFLTGATWGFKTTSLFMLLPAMLILHWRLSILTALKLVIAAAVVPFALFFVFDTSTVESAGAFQFIVTRLTVLQGDVAWYVWGLHREAEVFPNYWPTLLAAFSDSALRMVGIARDDLTVWMSYHYDWMMSYIGNIPLEVISEGHSITATPFAEGIIAGGVGGMFLFAAIAGVLIGRTYFHLGRAIKNAMDLRAALLSTYFCFCIFPWRPF